MSGPRGQFRPCSCVAFDTPSGRLVSVDLACLFRGHMPDTLPTDVVCFVGKPEDPATTYESDSHDLAQWPLAYLERVQEAAFGSMQSGGADIDLGFLNLTSKRHMKVYMAILKRMYSHMRNHKEQLFSKLAANGYRKTKIERCFNKVGAYSSAVKGPQRIVECRRLFEKMMGRRTTYTIVLEDTLRCELAENLRLDEDPEDLYMRVCQQLHERAAQLVYLPMQH